jgi:hypothetical protein
MACRLHSAIRWNIYRRTCIIHYFGPEQWRQDFTEYNEDDILLEILPDGR